MFMKYELQQETSSWNDFRWVRLKLSEVSLKAKFKTQDWFSFMESHYASEDLGKGAI
jgi:hypothetical protein